MATGLEIVGVALAVPGAIDVILRGATALWDRIDKYRTMDAVVSGHVQHVACGLDLAEAYQEVLDAVEDTFPGKLRYKLWRGRGSKYHLEKQSTALQKSCAQLQEKCTMLHEHRTGCSSYLWPADVFKVTHETVDNNPARALPNSDICVARGNFVSGNSRVDGDFVLESKNWENDARLLCQKLSRENLEGVDGMLPVLGYRQPPYNETDGSSSFQLIIELPQGKSWRSLEQMIVTERQPLLLSRLQICLKMAIAVDSVHNKGLKHKSIRPRAMLVLESLDASDTEFKICLQDWSLIREISGATTQMGVTQWEKAIYQHPQRQTQHAEKAYEPKHDIYSLGVSILQVLLWQPFVVESPGPSTRICDVFETYGLARGDRNDNTGLPERYRGNTAKLTSRPWATKAVWRDVAAGELGDAALARLVTRCLDGDGDGGFRSAVEVVRQLQALIKREQEGTNASSYTTF